MQLPEYITLAEVQRVCRELGFRDWTQLTGTEVLAGLSEGEVVIVAAPPGLTDGRRVKVGAR